MLTIGLLSSNSFWEMIFVSHDYMWWLLVFHPSYLQLTHIYNSPQSVYSQIFERNRRVLMIHGTIQSNPLIFDNLITFLTSLFRGCMDALPVEAPTNIFMWCLPQRWKLDKEWRQRNGEPRGIKQYHWLHNLQILMILFNTLWDYSISHLPLLPSQFTIP